MTILRNEQLNPLVGCYIQCVQMPNEPDFLRERFINKPLLVKRSYNKRGYFTLKDDNEERNFNTIMPAMPIEIEVILLSSSLMVGKNQQTVGIIENV